MLSDTAISCAFCGCSADLLLKCGSNATCVDCAGLGQLEFLPPGDPAFTRRARIASSRSVVVMGWNMRFNRIERQGILVEPAAIERAARDYLADVDQRPRPKTPRQQYRIDEDRDFRLEFAAAIREQFPGCPVDRAEAIALHATVCTSGWRARRYAQRSSGPDAVRLAVAASARHIDTDYDALLAAGSDRESAHAQVQSRVDGIIAAWRDGVVPLDG